MKKKSCSQKITSKDKKNFGGRATATGTNYEAQIATYIAAKMLGGSSSEVWDSIHGEEIVAITMQDAEPVDDVVVTLCGEPQSKVFISAKYRSGTISVTAKSPAFSEVISSFVRQFHKLSPAARVGSRLVWAVPSSAGLNMTQNFRGALDAFRGDASAEMSDFLRRRPPKERKAMNTLQAQIEKNWQSITDKFPNHSELHELIRIIYVTVFDFDSGFHPERSVAEIIRCSVAVNPGDSRKILETLELHFNQANRQGLRTTATSLRQLLTSEGLSLKTTPNFKNDVETLRHLTKRNLAQLKDHTTLRFANDEIHISRTEELKSMTVAAKHVDMLVTGEPGSGKSGLIHTLSEALINDGIPVVLLLAEEIFGHAGKAMANLPGLTHKLNDVLMNWPDGARGVLITDALDAVRDVELQKMLRHLLLDVRGSVEGWTVVATVREFDLKHGRELRESFPGEGVSGHSSKEFQGVSHFHVAGLAEAELDTLTAKAPEIGPFIASARLNPRAGGIHRSPFFLRLAAELLKNGASSARLADWSSPAILLRKFWKARVLDGVGASLRTVTLRSICRRMTELRSMGLSIQEVSLDASELDAINELRSRGILQSPLLLHGTPAGEDQLRFSHHLLHDYAIARSLIPTGSERFSEYAAHDPLIAIFYRQSFLYALEELWDGPDGRKGFWTCALKMEGVARLHGITRILAPILAARRVDFFDDLSPLFEAIRDSTSEDSSAEKAFRHLASGLQDSDDPTVHVGSEAWCVFAAKLSALLPDRPSLETPLVHVLGRLNAVCGNFTVTERHKLNSAAQVVLEQYVTKDVATAWRYAARTAIETLCRTFSVSPSRTEASLLLLLAPQRLEQFPHTDLSNLTRELKHLGSGGDVVVLRLFEAAFATEPQPGEWANLGGSIMPMRMQSSDNWNSIHYSLARYYESQSGNSAALMADIACIAWNATARRWSDPSVETITTFRFRGLDCALIGDYGSIRGREHEHEENRILSHFEIILDGWASSDDTERIGAALDSFAARNRTSLMWRVLMEAGAKYPSALGQELEPLLWESIFLTHPDYCYGGTLLFASLHKNGDTGQRKRLETLLLKLPQTARLLYDEPRKPIPSWLEHAQDKLLGSLDTANIVLSAISKLRIQRTEQTALPKNSEPVGIRVTSCSLSDEELMERRGVSLKDSVNRSLFRLREALHPFREHVEGKITTTTIEQNWTMIGRCERALRGDHSKHQKMAGELWGYLVAACENIACNSGWDSRDARWKTVRRILLKASTDSLPKPSASDNDTDHGCPSWGWPAPRINAARGLLSLIYRLGYADKETTNAVLNLYKDKSYPLRFNMAGKIALLENAAPELMWLLFDRFIRYERKFSVLGTIVRSLDLLHRRFPKKVKLRLSRIAKRAVRDASDESDIHGNLAYSHLFHFLRTGDLESELYIIDLIAGCDKLRSSNALRGQLHDCRAGGWLTIGDAVKIVESEEIVRKRTWDFLKRLLASAQTKLGQNREQWQLLHSERQPEAEEVEPIQDAIDHTSKLVDDIAMQVYFASGAFADKQNKDENNLTAPQKQRFWIESRSIFQSLASETHPHTAHQVVEALDHVLLCAPHDVFLIAADAIISSSASGFQHDSIAVDDVVKLIQHALADHKDIFKSSGSDESDCLAALLKVLDLFIEAGWPQARQLTYRLEEIYR